MWRINNPPWRNRRLRGGLVAAIGFILSPLSWWNDPFVNVPLAVGVAWVVAWFYPPAFQAAALIAYWLSNVLVLVLMHKGAQHAFGAQKPRTARLREWLLDLGVSLAYTLLIVLLLKLQILQPVGDYLRR
jgi:hypothetical protein